MESEVTQEEIEMSARLQEKAAVLTKIDPEVANECFLKAYHEVFIPGLNVRLDREKEIVRSPEFQRFMHTQIEF
jgi:hypothetical protein